MAMSHILGYPRIGPKREIKKVESYWSGDINKAQLLETGYKIRRANWQLQKDLGLDFVTVGDFSWYDHILDMSTMLGVVPQRFGEIKGKVGLDTFFNMGRGITTGTEPILACEMTKWFNTNYHYIVPEFYSDQSFRLATDKLFDEVREAKALGLTVKPVLIGPISYLWLGKTKGEQFDKLTLLKSILPIYREILAKLKTLDIEWVQIDEPVLALDLPIAWREKFELVYHELAAVKLKYLLATYFGPIDHNLTAIAHLPIEGLHVDLVSGKDQLIRILDRLSVYQILSCGVIDGRNIWRNDLGAQLNILEQVQNKLGNERVWIAPSCSLLHAPVDLEQESKLDTELKSWMSFAVQKVQEVSILCRGLNQGKESIAVDITEVAQKLSGKKKSKLINDSKVKSRMKKMSKTAAFRKNNYAKRVESQRKHISLPLFPTTTIGSFPQTKEIRHTRQRFKSGDINEQEYIDAMRKEIRHVIKQQEKLELDVLVHGEPERNDMVEYFGELLEGFAFTEHGWVQSYGSRCVKPPIIYGDISRTKPMTVEWIKYAQSLTNLPIKGMLTGPVTILCWSFVRDDQSLQETTLQIALALRDEVCDLEEAGVKIIQIDEPAFREGLPLLQQNQRDYLDWSVKAFKTSVGGVADKTQIHTHMCYSEFNELIEYIAAMDADVISIEASRSDMELLSAFENFAYPNEIGPGIYDIHSPNVPTVEIMTGLLIKAVEKISLQRLWVNPDCGLKTRGWQEVEESLRNMVYAAKILRKKYQEEKVCQLSGN